MEQHVAISGRYQGPASPYQIAILRFFDFNSAVLVQIFRKNTSEALGHMLDDDNTGNTFWHSLQQITDRLCTTGRGAYRYYILVCVENGATSAVPGKKGLSAW